ncbi:hypothetical protein R1flu_026099 [Riccia fluitans]|uniref:Fungal lipase-type domain-containing protein n=1 Tax=Riccia fluitans TaxID=41844 RepID=A0ABD1XHZ9_9MARC
MGRSIVGPMSSDEEESIEHISPSQLTFVRSSSTSLSTLLGTEPAKVNISTRWRELQGGNNWAGLLSPLDLDLRREILRYGDAVQVTYDAFPLESKSKYPFASPYKKSEVLNDVRQPATGYEVTRYLYSNLRGLKTEIQEVNWIGYVAVAVDPEEIKRLGRRDIIVALRGTRSSVEWQNDALFRQIPLTSINGKPIPKGVEVSSGFWGAFADFDASKAVFGVKGSAGKQATQEVKRLMEKYAGEQMSITCVGHSLGGALATLCSYQIAEDEIHKTPSGIAPVTAFTYASPRVGNIAFRERLKTLGVKILRLKCNQDFVPCFPLGDDTDNNPILDSVRQEGYLHLVNGIVGNNDDLKAPFKPVVVRDLALINKGGDLLADPYCKNVPANWWKEAIGNAGLVQNKEGLWEYPFSFDNPKTPNPDYD